LAARTVIGAGHLLRLAAASLLLLAAGAAPAQASRQSDWYSAVEQGREEAEATAREAASRAEQELRTRRLPPALAPALATTIRMTRDRAWADGVRPAPANVIRALSPYFSPGLLNQVRWRPPIPAPSMSSLLVRWYFREGAITLKDVVVFSDTGLAQDPGFWAHELTHVEQYRRYGVDEFARRYVNDWESLEREATQRAARVRAQMRRDRLAAAAHPTTRSAVGVAPGLGQR